MPSVLRRRAPLVLTALVAVAIAFPLGVLASHQFPDVPNSNPFHADIDALVDSGVTSGCGGGNYCPSGNVTREQMAAFLNRLGALAPGKTPVVNATKLDGKDSTAFVQHGEIVQYVSGGWAATVESSGATVVRSGGSTQVSNGTSSTYAALELTAPATFDGVAYGLAEVEVCFVNSTGATLGEIGVSQITSLGQGTEILSAQPALALGAANCYALPVQTSVAAVDGGLFLLISVAHGGGAATVRITNTKLTWAPASLVAP